MCNIVKESNDMIHIYIRLSVLERIVALVTKAILTIVNRGYKEEDLIASIQFKEYISPNFDFSSILKQNKPTRVLSTQVWELEQNNGIVVNIPYDQFIDEWVQTARQYLKYFKYNELLMVDIQLSLQTQTPSVKFQLNRVLD